MKLFSEGDMGVTGVGHSEAFSVDSVDSGQNRYPISRYSLFFGRLLDALSADGSNDPPNEEPQGTPSSSVSVYIEDAQTYTRWERRRKDLKGVANENPDGIPGNR